jgi:hypothetical protein
LSELEEALLIAAVGLTGNLLPDRPFQDLQTPPKPILGVPNLGFRGRAAGSTDDSQPTHFLLINDSGTYFLRRLSREEEPLDGDDGRLKPEALLDRARRVKVPISDRRLFGADEYRHFPYYLDSNRFLSNVPGSTVLLPLDDLSRQYLNALMYVLTESPKSRPTIVDDRNWYMPAGVGKWMKSAADMRENEFALNKDLELALGRLGTMRTEYEAYLLLQNLMLALQAMGLGGWIHASIGPPYLLGDPYVSPESAGLINIAWHVPSRPWWKRYTVDWLRWASPIAEMRANPYGLLKPGADPNGAQGDDWLIECLCPPRFTIDAAVERLVQEKRQLYDDRAYFRRAFATPSKGDNFVETVPHYESDVINCVKKIGQYIFDTHGRFPAHVDALFVPGVWLQAHHLNTEYYDQVFGGRGYTESQRNHDANWHGSGESSAPGNGRNL